MQALSISYARRGSTSHFLKRRLKLTVLIKLKLQILFIHSFPSALIYKGIRIHNHLAR